MHAYDIFWLIYPLALPKWVIAYLALKQLHLSLSPHLWEADPPSHLASGINFNTYSYLDL